MATKKNNPRREAEVQEAVKAVQDTTAAQVVSEIATLQVSLQTALADVNAKIVGKFKLIEQAETAHAEMQAQIQELYGIEKEAQTLAEVQARRQQAEKDAEQEQRDRDAERDLEDARIKQQRDRDEEQYNYDLGMKRRALQDALQIEIDQHKRSEELRREVLQREWDDRERALVARESKMTELEAKVINIPSDIEVAVAAAEKTLTEKLSSKFGFEKAMLLRDAEAAARLAAANEANLRAQITSLQGTIEEQSKQIAKLQSDNKEMVSKAFESHAGRDAIKFAEKALDQPNGGKSGR